MTLRLSPEADAKLQAIADARHVSKHAVVLQALDEYMTREIKTARALEIVDETSRDYAGLIKRLEDA